jgi:predicted RNA-binding Zn-ribbon protein involved in translation (DUF1610 family)
MRGALERLTKGNAAQAFVSDEEDQDDLEKAYWKYINPRMTDYDSTLACPKCGSKDVDHSRGYRGEYSCRACGKKWEAR